MDAITTKEQQKQKWTYLKFIVKKKIYEEEQKKIGMKWNENDEEAEENQAIELNRKLIAA